MHDYKRRFEKLLLDFLWRQWSALGVGGYSGGEHHWIIDPEPLLLATTSLGREPRLFDEMLDWLDLNGRTINLQRLKNLAPRVGEPTVLAAICATLAKRSVHSKWRIAAPKTGRRADAEPLFAGVPVFGKVDEVFAEWGWLRSPVALRGRSQHTDPHKPTNLLLKLRSLFGMQARAEIMAYLLAVESGHPGELAKQLGYFPKTVQTTLNDMAMSGHVFARRERGGKQFWLRREEWSFLFTWQKHSTAEAPECPRWVDWTSYFEALQIITHFLDWRQREEPPVEVQAMELRAKLDKMNSQFLREHLPVEPRGKGGDFVESVLEAFLKLLQPHRPNQMDPEKPLGTPSK